MEWRATGWPFCITALALLLPAAPAPAQQVAQDAPGPRILDTSNPFAAGAEEVPIDTPSAFVWSTYQSGQSDGWFYRIFPDGRGVLSRDPRFQRGWTAITCQEPAGCRAEGPSAPPAAKGVLDDLGRWVLRGGTPPLAPPPAPQDRLAAPAPPAALASDAAPLAGPPPDRPAPTPPDVRPVIVALPPPPSVSPAVPGPGRRPPPPPREQVADLPPPAPAPSAIPRRASPAATPRLAPAVPRDRVADRPHPSAPPFRTAVPPVRDAAAETAPSPPRAARPTRFDCTISGTFGLTYATPQEGDLRVGKISATAGCSYRHPSGLNIRLSLTGVPIAGQRSASDSSLSYALSYPLGRGYTLQYASYSAEVPRVPQRVISAFGQGGFRLTKALPPVDLAKWTGWEGLGRLSCSAFGAWDPGEKPSGGVSCGLTQGKLTLRASALVYSPGAQKEWQPDYTYSASYALNDRVAIEYSNYSGNRWPWNGGGSGRGLASGALRVTYRFSF